jgi:N-carbamoyl-L-amino-acid hydrolase
VSALEAASEALGLRWEKMPSRAYHDSLFMSRIAPTAMLFIPCRGGVSHRPDEYASPESIERGVWVLAHALVGLAG